jgi:hypothetical protein
MLQAVKEVAIPAMQRGEKVIILAQHLALLKLFASDPEIRFMGAALMTGEQSADERKEIIRRVSEDPKLMCVIGQNKILGTGHDLKGVEHIIILEPPHTVAEVIQGTNRHRRLITRATAHFAREEAHVHFVKPQLDLRVVELVKSEEHRKLLERGSLFEFWMDKMVKKSESYSVLTSQVSRIRLDPEAGLASVVRDLATLQEDLNRSREAFEKLTTEELRVLHERYRCPQKTEWRARLAAFTTKALPQLGKDRSALRLALLPGPEGLELEPHIAAGILPQNIYAFEADPSETVRDLCRKHVSQAGAHFFGLKMEQILPTLSPGVDIISYDTNSNTGPEFIEMLMSWQMPDSAIVLKNSLCGRESGERKAILEGDADKRKRLHNLLLYLAGSNLGQTLKCENIGTTVKEAGRIIKLADLVSDALSRSLNLERSRLFTHLAAIGCGGGEVCLSEQFQYQSAGGSPFLSTFAVLKRPTESLLTEKSMKNIAALLREVGKGSEFDGAKIQITVKSAGGETVVKVKHGAGKLYKTSIRLIRKANQYSKHGRPGDRPSIIRQ